MKFITTVAMFLGLAGTILPGTCLLIEPYIETKTSVISKNMRSSRSWNP
jgi:hypothetical protein